MLVSSAKESTETSTDDNMGIQQTFPQNQCNAACTLLIHFTFNPPIYNSSSTQKIFQQGRKEVQGMNHFAVCAARMFLSRKAETVAKEAEDPTKSN